MQKSNGHQVKSIVEVFDEALLLTQRIVDYLERKEDIADSVVSLYEKRKHLVEIIVNWIQEPKDENILESTLDECRIKHKKLLKLDAYALERYGDALQHLQSKIKDINKQKYLLIYSKGGKR